MINHSQADRKCKQVFFLHDPNLQISSKAPWPPAYEHDGMAMLTSLYAELSAVGHCGTKSAARASDKIGVTCMNNDENMIQGSA